MPYSAVFELVAADGGLDDELERQKMSSESTFFKQVSAMLKKVTTAGGGVMASCLRAAYVLPRAIHVDPSFFFACVLLAFLIMPWLMLVF